MDIRGRITPLCYLMNTFFLFLGMLSPHLAMASQNSNDPLKLVPVLVTAEKRSEDVQDIPASISVRSGFDIADARITNIHSLSDLTPNLYIANWGIRGTSYIFSRGIGAVNNEPAMGFYVDDVGYMDPRTFDFNLFDIERVEVLRGPQGSLYGRNSLAGVINIVTIKPDNEPRGGAEYSYGKYNLHQGGVHIRTPLVEDKVFLGISGNYESREGFSENSFLSDDVDSHESKSGRVHLRWTPSSQLEISLGLDAENLDDGAFPLTNLYALQQNPHKISYDYEGEYKRDVFGANLRVAYEADQFRLISVSSYRTFDDMARNDQDFTVWPMLTAWEDTDDSQLTQEFRLASKDNGGKLEWLIGLYGFYKDKQHFLNINFAQGMILPDEAVDRDGYSDVLTCGGALFGQLTYELFDALELTFGLRYDGERNRVKYTGKMYSSTKSLSQANTNESQDSNAFLPKFQIAWHPNQETMLYSTISRGYRSGGFNPAYLDLSDQFFDSEYSWNYELGLKSSWLDGRLITNAAVFYITQEDQQIVQLLPNADTVIRNGGKARSRGVELEATALLAKGLTLEAGIGFTDAVYTSYSDKLANTDYSDNHVPLAPEYTYNLALQYRLPVNTNMNLFSRVELNGVGDFYWNDKNTLKQDAYNLVNVNVGIESEQWDVFFWGRNLFDTEYESVAFEFPGSDPIGQSGDPITFGMTVRYRF